MTEQQLKDVIKQLKELRKYETDRTKILNYDIMIQNYEDQLRALQNKNNTKGESIGGGIGRLGGTIVSFVAGEFESCITGSDIKKSRAKYADGGEKAGKAIGSAVEKLTKFVRRK